MCIRDRSMVFHKTHGMNQPLFSMRTLYVSRTPADSSVYPTISAARQSRESTAAKNFTRAVRRSLSSHSRVLSTDGDNGDQGDSWDQGLGAQGSRTGMQPLIRWASHPRRDSPGIRWEHCTDVPPLARSVEKKALTARGHKAVKRVSGHAVCDWRIGSTRRHQPLTWDVQRDKMGREWSFGPSALLTFFFSFLFIFFLLISRFQIWIQF